MGRGKPHVFADRLRSRLTRARVGSEVIVQCGCRAVSKTLALAIHPGHYFPASGFACRAAPFLPNSS